MLRLPLEIKELFEEWLADARAGRRARPVADPPDARRQALYQAEFGTRMTGTGPYAELLRIRFRAACRRLNLNKTREAYGLDTTQFRKPPQKGDQLALL